MTIAARPGVSDHSPASPVKLHDGAQQRLVHTVGTLRVDVHDDGVGGARPDGSGLVGLGDRLAVLNGRLRVESPPEGGTLVAAVIPLSEQRSTSNPLVA